MITTSMIIIIVLFICFARGTYDPLDYIGCVFCVSGAVVVVGCGGDSGGDCGGGRRCRGSDSSVGNGNGAYPICDYVTRLSHGNSFSMLILLESVSMNCEGNNGHLIRLG